MSGKKSSMLCSIMILMAWGIWAQEIIPQGTWVHIPDESWNYAEVYTVHESGGACRIVRVDDEAGLSFYYQKGRMFQEGDYAVFSPERSYVMMEDDEGFSQASGGKASDRILGPVSASCADCIELGGLSFLSSRKIIEKVLACDENISRYIIPLVNITVFTLQSQIEGFGSDKMISYWKNPVTIRGNEGTVRISMRSSGTVLFVYPRLPIWLEMEFDSYSVFDGITVSGIQGTFARNRRGDGYLYGTLEIEGIGMLSYGDASGSDSIEIRDGTVSGGTIQAEIGAKTYIIDASVR